jgi:hypothetical protein
MSYEPPKLGGLPTRHATEDSPTLGGRLTDRPKIRMGNHLKQLCMQTIEVSS